eukprot:846201_1
MLSFPLKLCKRNTMRSLIRFRYIRLRKYTTGNSQSHAVISTFDMFSIGIGPSSSHTCGPMRASKKFIDILAHNQMLSDVNTLKCELYGSLALTGMGHGTDFAVILGLEGDLPDDIDPKTIPHRMKQISTSKTLNLNKNKCITFNPIEHLLWKTDEQLPYHPNGIKYIAYNAQNSIICQEEWYSIGG